MMEPVIHANRQISVKLRQTLDALLRMVPADMVFCKDHCLYIVPGSSATGSLHDHKVILEGADWNQIGYAWLVYSLDDIRMGIDTGKIFYNAIFTRQWLVYDNGYSVLPVPLPLRVAQTEQNGRGMFAFGYRRSQTFYQSALTLTAPEDTGVAAFMLHQSVELLLRAFLIAVTGQEVKSHTLSDLMKHVLRYAPGLAFCRTASGRVVHRLPDRLEKAYTGGRYSPHFQVSPEALQGMCGQVGLLQEGVKRAFEELMDAYGRYKVEAATCSAWVESVPSLIQCATETDL